MASFLETTMIFILVFAIFFPLINKVVRLASRTWDERENLDPQRVRQVVFLVPSVLLISFFGVLAGVIFLYNVLIF